MVIAVFRTVILYLLIIAGIRLMGKKQVGELEPAELVLAMLVSDLAAVPMQDFGIPLVFGVVPITVLFCLTMLLSVLTLKSVPLRLLLCGQPSILVQDGRLLPGALERNRMTAGELMEELRQQGVTDLTQIRYAILENSGKLSVLLCAQRQPLTPYDLTLAAEEDGLPLIVVENGHVYSDNLRRRGLNEVWLRHELERRHLTSLRQVYLLTVDETGGTYFVAKEEQP